jgi:Ca2+-dependent lipid-binding protein
VKSTNPIFNRIFECNVDPLKDTIHIQFVDTDDFNGEKKIGDVTISLTGLRLGEEKVTPSSSS